MKRQVPLRAVAKDERPVKAAGPPSILESAESESRLEELRAMRRRLARAMDDPNTPARDLAALSRRQLEIGREVESIAVQAVEQSVVADTPDEPWDQSAI